MEHKVRPLDAKRSKEAAAHSTRAHAPVDASRELLTRYERAVALLARGRYTDARAAFNALLGEAPPDLTDRIRMYIAACDAQVDHGRTEFRTHEERYDYAVSLLNRGEYDEANEHFKQILLENASADYAFYGLALLATMTGHPENALENLERAINLSEHNRTVARGDSDFANLFEDPRFEALLYPKTSSAGEDRDGSVLKQAVQVFGDLSLAKTWLSKPNERFGNRTPADMLATEAGQQEVDEMLGQIDEGMFA